MLLLLFIPLVLSARPRVISSLKTEKSMNYQGTSYNYMVYDMDYTEQLYLVENYPCSCINSCPEVEELTFNEEAKELLEGEKIEITLDSYILTRFYFGKSNGCKIVQITSSDSWGSSTTYIGVGRIPSPIDYDFVRRDNDRDFVRVCSEREGWGWGWWYVLVVAGESDTINNVQLSWNLLDTVECLEQVQGDILVDNLSYSDIVDGTRVFTFPLKGCLVSVSLEGDADLQLLGHSRSGKEDKVITLTDVCNHNELTITVTSKRETEFKITATTSTGFTLRRIQDIPPQQLVYSLKGTLLCGDDVIELIPVLPVENSHPWRTIPNILKDEYSSLPWEMKDLPLKDDIISNRLSFAQYLYSESINEGKVYSIDRECIFSSSVITNSNKEQVQDVLLFNDTLEDACHIPDELHELMSRIEKEKSLAVLKKYDVFHSLLMNSNQIVACRKVLRDHLLWYDSQIEWPVTPCLNNTIDIKKAYDLSPNISRSTCLTNFLYHYIAKGNSIRDCNNQWTDSLRILNNSMSFVTDCYDMLVEKDTFYWKTCIDTCHYNKSCIDGRCDYSQEDINTCMWNEMNLLTKKSLTNYWKLNDFISEESFNENLQRYKKELCVGPERDFYQDVYTIPWCLENGCPFERIIVDRIECDSVIDGCSYSSFTREQCLEGLCLQDFTIHNATECMETLFTKGGCSLELDKEDCLCSGGIWEDITSEYGKVQQLQWNQVRARKIMIDVDSFQRDVIEATEELYSLTNLNNVRCRNHITRVYFTVNCVENNGTDCYYVFVNAKEEWICPGIDNVISHGTLINRDQESAVNYGDFVVTIREDVLPKDHQCQKIDIDVYPITLYQQQIISRLSSQSFTEQPLNIWSAVKDRGHVIGQIITNAFDFIWEFEAQEDIEICVAIILLDEYSSPLFTTLALGKVDGANVAYHSLAKMNDNGDLCAKVRESGRYIGIKIREVDNTPFLVQCIISSIIYFLLSIFVVWQMAILYIGKVTRWQLKVFTSLIMIVFLVIRGVYFIIYSQGNIETSVSYFFFEFPNFLFLVLGSIIIRHWIEISDMLKNLSFSKQLNRLLMIIWISWNTFIIVCFATFMAGYYALIGEVKNECSLAFAPLSEESIIFNQSYVIFVVFVYCILFVAILISGYRVIAPYMHDVENLSSPVFKFLVMSWMMIIVFSISLLVKSGLMIASAFGGIVIPILGYTVQEFIPFIALIYYLNPPIPEKLKQLSNKVSSSSKKTSSGGERKTNTGGESKGKRSENTPE